MEKALASTTFILCLVSIGCAPDSHDDSVFGRTGTGDVFTAEFDTIDGRQELAYEVIDGQAIFQGDIVLGAVDNRSASGLRSSSAAISGAPRRWPNGVVPYVISSNLPDHSRVTAAIAHWNTRTPVRLVPRTGESDWVEFVPHADSCLSYVGRIGGRQAISLALVCNSGTVIHEIGHAVGLWHEQSRADRDQHVEIHWENIESGKAFAFDKYTNGRDYGPYDFDSIMHYGSTYFSSNGLPTITRLSGATINPNRTRLSTGDIGAVTTLYGCRSGASCDDGNPCTDNDRCQGSTCQGSPVICSASDQCHTAGVCNPSTGVCTQPLAADYTPCEDENLCTQADHCIGGRCRSGEVVDCPALNQCHATGVCDPTTGLCSPRKRADGAVCDDGDACSQRDVCVDGDCRGFEAVQCQAQDECRQAGVCDSTSGVCTNPLKEDGARCDDGDACTLGDACHAGACGPGTPVVCETTDACHSPGTCAPQTGACSAPELDQSCSELARIRSAQGPSGGCGCASSAPSPTRRVPGLALLLGVVMTTLRRHL